MIDAKILYRSHQTSQRRDVVANYRNITRWMPRANGVLMYPPPSLHAINHCGNAESFVIQ